MSLTATAVCGPSPGASSPPRPSPPASLYAPSALVLTVGHGESAATAHRYARVTLTCAPEASGTHPAAESACAELRGAGGDFDALAGGRRCAVAPGSTPPWSSPWDGVWAGAGTSPTSAPSPTSA
ncbi:subtilase-type protease inhibitor [Streptomyces thinghirensis]|nr:subtilase-type protease inhibitor [Streptomyces thinghirensis]